MSTLRSDTDTSLAVPIKIAFGGLSAAIAYRLLVSIPLPGTDTPLAALLTQIISGGFAAAITYRLLESPFGQQSTQAIADHLSFLAISVAEVRRYAAAVLSTAIALSAYVVAVLLALVPEPADIIGWINVALVLLGVGYTGSQQLHARLVLRAKTIQRVDVSEPRG